MPNWLGGPDAELRCLDAVDAIADRDNRVEVVELDFPGNVAAALALNSLNFSKSCLPAEFARGVNLFQVVTYGGKSHPKQFGDFLLIEPKRLILEKHLDPDRTLPGLVQEQLAFVRPFRFGHAMFLPQGE